MAEGYVKPLPPESAGTAPGRGRLKGRNILIVGGGQRVLDAATDPVGNGRAMSILFAREGASVAVADMNLPAAEETVARIAAEGGTAMAIEADISKPGDVARLKEVQMQIHAHFINWVKDRRGGKLEGTDEELFEGRFWTGSAALDMGIADEVGDVRTVMREKYGEDIRLIELSPDKRLPFLPSVPGVSDAWVDDAIRAVEDRALWGRFGV